MVLLHGGHLWIVLVAKYVLSGLKKRVVHQSLRAVAVFQEGRGEADGFWQNLGLQMQIR